MEINGQVTILFDNDGMAIDVIDDDASVKFCSIRLNPEQTCKALSRLGHCSVEKMEVRDLAKVGKVLEYQTLRFKLTDDKSRHVTQQEHAREEVHLHVPAGWEPDLHFGSQGSFWDEDEGVGKKPSRWAKTIIRRWVDKKENEL